MPRSLATLAVLAALLLPACQTGAGRTRPAVTHAAPPAAEAVPPAAGGTGAPVVPDEGAVGRTQMERVDPGLHSLEDGPQVESDDPLGRRRASLAPTAAPQPQPGFARRTFDDASALVVGAVDSVVQPIGGVLGFGQRDLLGLSQPAIAQTLGPPMSVRQESPAEVWQYRNGTCVLDVVFYGAAQSQATHISARAPWPVAPGQVQPVDSAACAASMAPAQG